MRIISGFASMRFGALAMVLCSGLAYTPSGAQVRPPEEGYQRAPNADFGPGLAFFDARLDADGVPLAKVTARVDALKKTGAWSAREADTARMRGMVDGLAIDEDPLMGTARFVRATWKFLTPAKFAGEKWTPTSVVKDFMGAYPALMEGAAAEIDTARVERDFGTDHSGVRHLTYQQQVRGVDLFEAEVRANVTRNGELINLQNTMLPRPAPDFATPAVKFDASAAIIIAAANVGVRLSSRPVPVTDPAGASMKQEWAGHPDLRPDERIITELVYFALDRDTIHPAWHVVVPVKGVGHTYDVHVDAADGSILRRHDRLVWDTTQPVTMRIYPSDGIAPGSPGTAAPTGFQFPVVARQLITWNPIDVSAFSPNGWINDGATQTVGNNVDAHTDINADNVADLPRPDGGAARVLDFTYNPGVDPATQRPAVVTELFFRVNWYHDKIMALGFNEAAGNFQTTNFSGQGLGGDAIQADAQDGSGTNNANFATSGSDGSGARCQMYLFTGPTPDRDGSFEGDIVYHELTHGTSIRLHGGLSGTQSGGMGEGWSDFVGICLLAEPTDDPDGVYCTGGYTTYQLGAATFTNNYYFGIRRYPYSTDMLKGPLTYKDIAVAQAIDHQSAQGIPRSPVIGNTANEVHSIGEVWCNMLNDGRAGLWHAHGFPGNQRMLQLVIDGMKLSPANPTLIQARDSILAADNADFAGVDVPALWTAFARRGLGFSATSPASSTTVGVFEAYDTPPKATFTFPDGLPTQLLPGVGTTFRVNVASAVAGTPIPGTGRVFVSVNGGTYAPAPLTIVADNQYSATIPPSPCFAAVRFWFDVQTSTGLQPNPPAGTLGPYAALTYTGSATPVNDGFEADLGWTTGTGLGDTATTGQWVRAVPVGTAAQTGSAHGGTVCWVTGNAAPGAPIGTNDVDNGFTTLISPAFNLSGHSDATVSYWRWYYNSGSTNTARIDVSVNDGTTWTRAETLGPGTTPESGGGWRQASWTFSSLGLTPSAQVKVRYIVEDITATIVEGALDDFRIDTFTCSAAISTGACCAAPAGSCSVATQAACNGSASGAYQGDSTSCSPSPCAPTSYSVTITKSGSGRGTVTSSVGGISCGVTCSGSVPFGTNLTLAAAPDSNSTFIGWTGACDGSGDCLQTIAGPITTDARFNCKADFNGVDSITVQDIFDFLAAWFSGSPSADFNGINGITVQDIFDFLAAWFTGCP